MIWFSWTILSNINDYVTMCAFNHIVIKGMCLNYRTSVHGIMVLMVWIVVLTKDVATVGKRMNEIKLKCSFMVNKGWSKRGYYISRSVWYYKKRHLLVGLISIFPSNPLSSVLYWMLQISNKFDCILLNVIINFLLCPYQNLQ